MELEDLSRRLQVILDIEERDAVDWAEVDRLASELHGQVHIDATPEVVHHYLNDAGRRAQDQEYGARQRRQIRKFIELEYDDSAPMPLWGCALTILIVTSLAWLLMSSHHVRD